jgi:hypothetical protein
VMLGAPAVCQPPAIDTGGHGQAAGDRRAAWHPAAGWRDVQV